MFQQEHNGYNRKEVDSFIQSIKSSYEAKLMAEKLKVLESERKLLNLQNEKIEIENKEKSIINALNVLEKQKNFQEEGSKKFNSLIIDKIQLLINELDTRLPHLRKNRQIGSIIQEFEEILNTYKQQSSKNRNSTLTNPVFSENDSMRMLLNKMQDYKKGLEAPKEIHINTNFPKPRTTYVSPLTIPDDDSGFSFAEALNPTEDLDEIMKAFDFYGQN